jgi:hypothetical protein
MLHVVYFIDTWKQMLHLLSKYQGFSTIMLHFVHTIRHYSYSTYIFSCIVYTCFNFININADLHFLMLYCNIFMVDLASWQGGNSYLGRTRFESR